MTVTALDPDLIRTFPFPFPEETYRYSTNVQPAGKPEETPVGRWGETVIHVDSEYENELAARERILAADPSRLQVLPHMKLSAWDAMLALMQELAVARPEQMSLVRTGTSGPLELLWTNRLLGIEQRFVYGDESTLPQEPLGYIGSQVQEDIVLLDQREGQLYADAGVVTFAADWSFGFDVGMSFLEIHGPVPRVRQTGVITRAQKFIMRLQAGEPYRRTNWSMTVGRRLDVSTDTYPEWGPDRGRIQTVDDETFGAEVHLRVEVQHLIRLPQSGSVMFLIRTYMLPLEAIAQVEPWSSRFESVLAELPEDMADYKGFLSYRDRAVEWLRAAAPAAAISESRR